MIIPFQAAGQSHYSVTNATLVSVAGFTTAGLTTPMYEGQDVIFENQTGHDITLKDSFGVDTSFVIGADLIVPNEGKIWFRFRNNELELIDKNWFEINEVATAQNLGEFINSLDSKTDVKDTDEFVLSDGDDGLKSKKTRFLDIKNKLKGYFDTLYLSLSIFNDFVTDVFSSLDNKLDKSTTPSSVYGTNTAGQQTMIPLTNFGTVKGTGTTNRISKFTASGTIGDSQIFDNGINVGIGIENPTFTLDVLAATSNVRVSSSVGTNRAYTQFANTGGTFNVGLDSSTGGGLGTNVPYAGTIMHYGNYPIVIGTNATERVRISNSGNVGIGVTNPQTRLDISNGDFHQLKLDNSVSSQKLWFGSIADTIGSFIGNNTKYTNSLQFTPNFTSASGIYFRQDGSTEFFNNTGLTNGVLYTPSVSVKIGNTGNVGIGTTSPGARLDVVGLFDALPARILRQASYGEILRIGRNGVTETASINYPANGVFAINTNSSERMRIDASGNVNIGTTTTIASAKLVVESTTQGFLPPRMTTTQKNAITSPAAGLIVYDTTDNKHYGYNGTTWNALY